MAKNLGVIKNWDGIPVYDLNTGMYLLKFDEDQKKVMDDLLWCGGTREEWQTRYRYDKDKYYKTISLLAYPGLSPEKMRILEQYIKSYYNESDSEILKKEDPDTWMFLWKLIHADVDNWAFMVIFFIYFNKRTSGSDVLIPSGVDLFSIFGDDIRNYNALMLLTIGEGYIDNVEECKNFQQLSRNDWELLESKVRKTCLRIENDEYQKADCRIFNPGFSLPPKNMYNSADKYANYMDMRNYLIRFYNDDPTCSVNNYIDTIGMWKVKIFSKMLPDNSFNKDGEYI